jgi:hypothetical protein
MLAKIESEIPRGPGWTYEPKWDEFHGKPLRSQSRERCRIRLQFRGPDDEQSR